MEDQEGESLDGSSIKPVSSLRSHFEQMTKLTPKTTAAPPRPISPKPKTKGPNTSASTHPTVVSIGHTSLKAPGLNGSISPAPFHSSGRQRPLSKVPTLVSPASPSVTVEPPSSPSRPLDLDLNLTISSASPLLTVDDQVTSSRSGSSSPHYFRIPSRPHTPLTEHHQYFKASTVHPPEPPPPRRSGELRRDTPSKMLMGPPPPVNRAEKPKIPGKQFLLSSKSETINLTPVTSQTLDDQVSPFSTPPSSDSSPGLESIPPRLPGNSPFTTQLQSRSSTPIVTFDPPPIHHSLVSMRKDQESNIYGQGRGGMSAQISGDMRDHKPALPVRPNLNNSTPIPGRISMDIIPPPKVHIIPIDVPRSSKSGTTTTRDTDNLSSFPFLPKRNFSTPTSQLQTPPRSHGRSMTIDQTSNRTPMEYRTTEKPIHGYVENNDTIITSRMTMVGPPIPVSSNEYPDISFSNRRPPHFQHGPFEIMTKYDTRIFDIFGEYICTTGHYTRVWSLLDGEQVMSLSHGEAIKILSLAFKPAAVPVEEGSRLWLGNNFGELLEVDITSQSPIVATNNTAHNRREIVKIHRHKNEMWTLDEGGALHVWASDKKGFPTLENPAASYRVPKGHSFSMVVHNELWHAVGEEIRVYLPTTDGRTQFQLLQKPLSQPGTGEVTSGAVIHSQLDRIYFGHADGKVSIYSSQDYTCIGIANISMYKINSLTGVGDYLWAAYNTGSIFIYDTTQVPWVVRKDWRAHVNPVINVVVDRSSFWKLGRYQVVSLGADNALRLWDGLLQKDWLERELQTRDESFCSLEQIKTSVMTWNAGASTPYSLRYAEQDKIFFPNLLKESGAPDIFVFGFQELVDLEDKKTTAKSLFSKSKKKDPSEQEYMSHQYRDWRDYIIRCLDESMPKDELYHLLYSANLVGLFTCVFVRGGLRDRISGLGAAEIKRGLGGRAGNKGALILRFMVDDTSFCFINCHLAAGQNQTKDRNFDISSILDSTVLPAEEDEDVRLNSYIGGGDGSMILDHEICILSGDLNYRIDTMGREAVINTLKSGKLDRLLERDQLLASKRKRPGFRLRAFNEMPITFAPTYKYDVGTDNYDTSEKKRAPAWCDRILSRGRDRKRLEPLDYRRHEVRVSDHRPVTGLFHMTIKKISHEKRAVVWEECRQRFEEVKQRVGTAAQLDFLVNVCGLDNESCRKFVLDRPKVQR